MHRSLIDLLRCPHCREPLRALPGALGCDTGHRFDLARQGYVNLLGGRRTTGGGDTAAMVQARLDVFAAGQFAPLAEVVAAEAVRARGPGCVLDAGCGPGYYLREVVAATQRPGIGCDVSTPAVRRLAGIVGGASAPGGQSAEIGAVVADVWHGLPVADGSVATLLNVFAPRNGADFARLLHPEGRLIVVTPQADHLAGLVDGLGLLGVDPAKQKRLERSLAPWFAAVSATPVRWSLDLDPRQALTLATMGPSAHHVDEAELAHRAATRPVWSTSGSVLVQVFRPGR